MGGILRPTKRSCAIGSGIGPIAFIIYIDHLVKLIEQSGICVKVFADDMKVILNCLMFSVLLNEDPQVSVG